MIVSGVTLNNYKGFKNKSPQINLSSSLSPDKPIILIGGSNGAGKSSLFNALKLCLYGQTNKNLWPSTGAKKQDYVNYVLAVTNDSAKAENISNTIMWIKIDIDDVEIKGIRQEISIKRTWIVDSYQKTIKEETLEITRAGKPIEYYTKDDYEVFINNSLIPQDVSDFFFFDGEKIQALIQDEDKEFANSFEAVLGISLYKTLYDDLETTRSRIFSKYNKDKSIEIQINNIEGEILELEKGIDEKEEEISNLKSESRKLAEKITEIDINTKRITSLDIQTKQDYEQKKSDYEKRIAVLESNILQIIQKDLPFVMLSRLGQESIRQLKKEEELTKAKVAYDSAMQKIKPIIRELFFDGDQFIEKNIRVLYAERLKTILERHFAIQPVKEVEIIHNLSPSDNKKIEQRLNVTQSLVAELPGKLGELQELEVSRNKIKQAERKALDEDVKKLYEERGTLFERQKIITNKIENCKTVIMNSQDQITTKRRQLTMKQDEAAKSKVMKEQMDYCEKLRDTIDVFSRRLRTRKVELLQGYVSDMWFKLNRKVDFISKIEIDPANYFAINLYNSAGRLIDKTEQLSAGEKEILAVSIIWGLSKLTNRLLPIIIDTPLARLDTDHRTNIIKIYYPNASHQVIILSSNEELVGKHYESIRPFVCQHYLIEEGDVNNSTTIREGYFNHGN